MAFHAEEDTMKQANENNRPTTCLYMDNTGADTRDFHAVIAEACANDGEFGEDFSDIFTLTRCPEGSACEWALNFAEDK